MCSLLTAGATADTASVADDSLQASYRGPTVTGASGAFALSTPLLGAYPTHGVVYGLPLYTEASTTYDASRLYQNM